MTKINKTNEKKCRVGTTTMTTTSSMKEKNKGDLLLDPMEHRFSRSSQSDNIKKSRKSDSRADRKSSI